VNDRQSPLPPEWAWTTLGIVAEVRLGKMLSPKAYEDGLIQLPYLRNENVRWGHIDFTDVKLMGFKSEEIARYQVNEGDLLVCEGGEPGRAAVFSGKSGQYMYQKALHRVRPRADAVNTKFLQLFFQHGAGQAPTSQTTIAHLPLEKMLALALPLPPRAEQQRIISEVERQFTRLDAGVDSLKRVQAQLKRYRASVLRAACEGRLVPTEAELARHEERDYEPADKLLARILKERRARWEADQLAKMKAAGKLPKDDTWKAKYSEPDAPDVAGLPSLPEGWVWAGPDQLSAPEDWSLGIGPFGSNLKVSDYREAGVPLVFVRNIRSGRFGTENRHYVTKEKADELRPHEVKPGDVLVTKMGEPPGDACLYPVSEPAGVITADCIRLRLSSLLLHREFFVHCINSQVIREQILRLTQGVAQQKISLERFRTLALPVPPLEEQRRILGRIDEHLSVELAVRTLTASSGLRATRLRQAVLRQAFAGKLAPQSPSDEPASKLLERISAAEENKSVPKQGRAKQATAVPKVKATR